MTEKLESMMIYGVDKWLTGISMGKYNWVMKITQYGHCCFLVEEQGLTVLTDPGSYSIAQSAARGVDAVLITHEHPDHLHLDSLREVLANNPSAKVITNTAVGRILDEAGISFEVLEHGQRREEKGVLLEGLGDAHAEIYGEFGLVQNTGYFIGEKLFYPGDAFYNPQRAVHALALPVAGPWMRLRDAIVYASELRPEVCFPVHDGMLRYLGPVHALPEKALSEIGIGIEFNK